jgi:hypothetical protein
MHVSQFCKRKSLLALGAQKVNALFCFVALMGAHSLILSKECVLYICTINSQQIFFSIAGQKMIMKEY